MAMKSALPSPSISSTSGGSADERPNTLMSCGSLPIHLEPYLTSKPLTKADEYAQKHNVLVILNALSLSPDKEMVVVAGRELLKVFSLSSEEKEIKEVLNMRSGCRLNQNIGLNDVKWCQNYAKGLIATAATNGAIHLWNINKSGPKIERTISEHTRSVNRVAFHPTEPFVLSASQDGTMKLWDLRTKLTARQTFEGKAESVRDLQCSPTSSHSFAAVFETGIVQKWDTRMATAPEKRFTAHNGIALTLDYHSHGRYLATGGRDKQVKIWDLLEDTRKPVFTVQTIAPVGRVAWRPHTLHITVCALQSDFRTHVFDLQRPWVPRLTFTTHTNLVTGLVWRNAQQLWSCGKDKVLACAHVDAATPPELSTSAVAWHPAGRLCVTLQGKAAAPELGDSTKSNASTGSMFSRRASGRKSDKTMDEISKYKPNQVSFDFDPCLFDPASLAHCARHYHTADFPASCLHNAEVARAVGRSDVQHVWLLLHRLVALAAPHDPFVAQRGTIVEQIFEHFSQLGDVQFCCTLFLLLRSSVTVTIFEARIEQWFLSYIELLHRFMLFDLSATILQTCPIPSLAKKLQDNTTIHLLCQRCSKPILKPSPDLPTCDRCFKLLNTCSLCHKNVKGPYSWCQGCNHGGHLSCLVEWFKISEECCTGCGHCCLA